MDMKGAERTMPFLCLANQLCQNKGIKGVRKALETVVAHQQHAAPLLAHACWV